MSALVGWELPSRDHYFARDVDRLIATHHELLSKEHAIKTNRSDPVLARTPQAVPLEPWSTGVAGDAGAVPGSEPFKFSWATTPTSTSNSPINNDPGFFWTPSTQAPAEGPTMAKNGQHQQAEASVPKASKPRHRPAPLPNAALATLPTGGPGGALGIQSLRPSPTENQTDGTLACTICGKVLSGKLVYLPSNMKRHMRELHSSAAKRLVCGVEGCGRAFHRRHNLVGHQKAVHGVRI